MPFDFADGRWSCRELGAHGLSCTLAIQLIFWLCSRWRSPSTLSRLLAALRLRLRPAGGAVWTRLRFTLRSHRQCHGSVSADGFSSSTVVVLLGKCASCLALSLPAVFLLVVWGGHVASLGILLGVLSEFHVCVSACVFFLLISLLCNPLCTLVHLNLSCRGCKTS